MRREHNLVVRRGRAYGVMLCVVAAVAAAVFVYGMMLRSYWALAVPVAAGVLCALWLVFWIGWTIATVRGIPAEAEQYRGLAPRLIAVGLCALTVLAAAGFLYGVALRSYWALAVPVAIAVLGLLGMVFWIGVAIVTQKSTLPDAAPAAPSAATPVQHEGEA